VAVRDPLPLFTQGVVAALADADVDVDTPVDVLGWVTEGIGRAVILTLGGESDWTLLAAIRERDPRIPILVLLDDASVTPSVAAVGMGANSVLARNCSTCMLRRTMWMMLSGGAVVPADVLRSLAAQVSPPDASPPPSDEALGWLRDLAGGATVAALAARAGYSERAMFRLLRDLYVGLGVRNRTEALMLAQERGWLAPPRPEPTAPLGRPPVG
jgi:DNA-binding NarL/FixJ family response regulator